MKNSIELEQFLKCYKINAKVKGVINSTSFIQYQLKIETGTRFNKINNLEKELSAFFKSDVSFELPIKNSNLIAINVTKKNKEIVNFKNINIKKTDDINLLIGINTYSKIKTVTLNELIHLLVAGSTGSGKSNFLHIIIQTILKNYSPDEIRLILIDPKQVEFSIYNNQKHLLVESLTNIDKILTYLKLSCDEVDYRYRLFKKVGINDINKYNKKFKKLSRILIIIDEFNELIMTSEEIEKYIIKIAQLGRACGVHLILATQRPSREVITGLIKANIPSRAIFMLPSKTDSRIALDVAGAESLNGKGDMLFKTIASKQPERLQAPYVEI